MIPEYVYGSLAFLMNLAAARLLVSIAREVVLLWWSNEDRQRHMAACAVEEPDAKA